MKCPFKGCENKEDNKYFDDPVWHFLITVGFNGHVHLHGAIEDESVVRRIVSALVEEGKKLGYDLTKPPKQQAPVAPATPEVIMPPEKGAPDGGVIEDKQG